MKISLDWSSADWIWTIKRCIIWTGQLGQIKLDWVLQIISVSDYISFLRLIFKVLTNTVLLFSLADPSHDSSRCSGASLSQISYFKAMIILFCPSSPVQFKSVPQFGPVSAAGFKHIL